MAKDVGLLSDTHVPYRAAEISSPVIEALHGVDLILHAGDVDEPWALKPLQAVAPVYAVRGNYHLFDRSCAGKTLPVSIELDIEGHHVVVTHGHQIGFTAWLWKGWMTLLNLVGKWYFPRYDRLIVRKLLRRFPDADVIVFGHTHRFYETWQDDVLVINPGAALHTSYFGAPLVPSIARLVLARGETPEVQRIDLN